MFMDCQGAGLPAVVCDSGSGGGHHFVKSLSLGGGGSLGAASSFGYASSASASGRTMREYEDTLRDLKKENFNLKLRIYFLEERLGGGGGLVRMSAAGSKEDLLQSNIDLKVMTRKEIVRFIFLGSTRAINFQTTQFFCRRRCEGEILNSKVLVKKISLSQLTWQHTESSTVTYSLNRTGT